MAVPPHRDGYTSVTFITDADKQFTCGSGTAGRNPQAWTDDGNAQREEGDNSQWGARVQAAAAGLNDTLLLHTSSGELLHLQFADHVAAEGIDTDGDREAQLQDVDDDNNSSEDGAPRASSRRAARRARHATGRRAHTHHNHRAPRAQAYPTQARLPGHLKKFFTEPEATTAAHSGRGSAARTLLVQPLAVRTTTGSNDSATAPVPAAARTSAAAEPATWWWFDWGHNGNNQPDRRGPSQGCVLLLLRWLICAGCTMHG